MPENRIRMATTVGFRHVLFIQEFGQRVFERAQNGYAVETSDLAPAPASNRKLSDFFSLGAEDDERHEIFVAVSFA
jgi:hypothetical protein